MGVQIYSRQTSLNLGHQSEINFVALPDVVIYKVMSYVLGGPDDLRMLPVTRLLNRRFKDLLSWPNLNVHLPQTIQFKLEHLFNLIRKGASLETVKECMSLPTINSLDFNRGGTNPLYVALIRKQTSIAHLLWQTGRFTPNRHLLREACENEDLELIEAFLKHNRVDDSVYKEGLNYSIERRKIQSLKTFIKHPKAIFHSIGQTIKLGGIILGTLSLIGVIGGVAIAIFAGLESGFTLGASCIIFATVIALGLCGWEIGKSMFILTRAISCFAYHKFYGQRAI